MDIKSVLDILSRRKWVIIITLIATMAVVAVGTYLTPPTYKAAATVRIATAASGSINYSDYVYSDRILNTYVKIATSGPILDELKKRLNVTVLPKIDVQIVPTTELIQISVEAGNPVFAVSVANTLSDILIKQSSELYSGTGKRPSEILAEQVAQVEKELALAQTAYNNLAVLTPSPTEQIGTAGKELQLKQQTYETLMQQYQETKVSEAVRANIISSVDPAVLPSGPSKPNKMLNYLVGFMAGLIGGLGLALLFENLDTTLHSSNQVESAIDLPTLAEIPSLKKSRNSSPLNGDSIEAEAFRRLKTNIFFLNQDNSLRKLLVTSAQQGEGKSSVVAGLAIAIAQSGKTVCVVDGDVRLPTQHKIFELPNTSGLTTVLYGDMELIEALKETKYDGLFVLPSGPTVPNPTVMLSSRRMTEILDRLTVKFDYVLGDTPSLLAVADTLALAPLFDSVVLVIGRELARKEAVLSASKQLKDVNAKLIGIIINRAVNADGYYYYNHRNGKKAIDKIASISFLGKR